MQWSTNLYSPVYQIGNRNHKLPTFCPAASRQDPVFYFR